jgi:hypothetical protein
MRRRNGGCAGTIIEILFRYFYNLVRTFLKLLKTIKEVHTSAMVLLENY